METVSVLFALTVAAGLVSLAEAHGRLILPPSRSSMWRFGFPTPKNYQDMQLWCGGLWVSSLYNKKNILLLETGLGLKFRNVKILKGLFV